MSFCNCSMKSSTYLVPFIRVFFIRFQNESKSPRLNLTKRERLLCDYDYEHSVNSPRETEMLNTVAVVPQLSRSPTFKLRKENKPICILDISIR